MGRKAHRVSRRQPGCRNITRYLMATRFFYGQNPANRALLRRDTEMEGTVNSQVDGRSFAMRIAGIAMVMVRSCQAANSRLVMKKVCKMGAEIAG
jgi:hypothetical protein